jgi:hypothetical protein
MPLEIAVLESEGSVHNVSEDDLRIRRTLAEQFRKLPVEFFTHLRHLQPQVGCLNRCSICSQNAGTVCWYLNEKGLANLFSTLKTIAIEVAQKYITRLGKPYLPQENILTEDGVFAPEFQMPSTGLLGYGRTHRPGVIYCYLDNDPGSYTFLDKFLQYAYEDLGIKVRISTIGYSRHNRQLQLMHKRINSQLIDAIAGVRLSITSYPYGWTAQGEASGITSRAEFVEDIANFLKVYGPSIYKLGIGEKTACVELRFRPLVVAPIPVVEDIILGHHVIRAGPYVLISVAKKAELQTTVVKAAEGHSLVIDGPLYDYVMLISDELVYNGKTLAERFIQQRDILEGTNRIIIRRVKLCQLENDDGIYWVVDPVPNNEGFFEKQFYPKTTTRPSSGYIDSERYFLNTLLAYKRKRGLSRRAPFLTATWQDVRQVLADLEALTQFLATIDCVASKYIKEEVLPLISAYAFALENAGYPPSFFFDRNFTRDTGIICNLGRAISEFKYLASRSNLPLTPRHERAYGRQGSLSKEGVVWRLSVAPFSRVQSSQTRSSIGGRNIATQQPSLLIEELDLAKTASSEGQVIQRIIIPFDEAGIESISISHLRRKHLIPGQRVKYVKGGKWVN